MTHRPLAQEHTASLATYQEMVETTIDLSELSRHNFAIKADFDEGLKDLRDQLEGVRDQLNDEHNRVADDLKMDADGKVLHFENSTVYGHCFRLTRKVRRVVPSCIIVVVVVVDSGRAGA